MLKTEQKRHSLTDVVIYFGFWVFLCIFLSIFRCFYFIRPYIFFHSSVKCNLTFLFLKCAGVLLWIHWGNWMIVDKKTWLAFCFLCMQLIKKKVFFIFLCMSVFISIWQTALLSLKEDFRFPFKILYYLLLLHGQIFDLSHLYTFEFKSVQFIVVQAESVWWIMSYQTGHHNTTVQRKQQHTM